MPDIVIIADDFTGAVDTAVPFAASGLVAEATLGWPAEGFGADVAVAAVSTASRHLPARQAGEAVAAVAQKARVARARILYKKTDSALRGHLGAELSALLGAGGVEQLHFLPAYPENGRTTRDGVQLFEGMPIAGTALGSDPFEPLRHSRVADIIAEESGVPVASATEREAGAGVLLYDAGCRQDIDEACRRLAPLIAAATPEKPLLLAGCAGFALSLAGWLGGEKAPAPQPGAASLLLVSASLHPATAAQLAYAEGQGFRRLAFSPKRSAEAHRLLTPAGEEAAPLAGRLLGAGGALLLNTAGDLAPEAGPGAAEKLEEQRALVSALTGAAVEQIMAAGHDRVLCVIGGDTLAEVAGRLYGGRLRPVAELGPGVALCRCRRADGSYGWLSSRSGGFGGQEAVVEWLSRFGFFPGKAL